jgi:hypothetical protein
MILGPRHVELEEVTEWTLRFAYAREHVPLNYDFSIGGHLHVESYGWHHPNRLPFEPSGEFELVLTGRQGGRRGKAVRRVNADDYGDRQIRSQFFSLLVQYAQLLRRHHPNAGLGGTVKHHPVNRDVSRACDRIVGEHHSGCDVRSCVFRGVGDDRKPTKVDMLAGMNNLLDGAALDAFGRNPARKCLTKASGQVSGFDIKRQGQRLSGSHEAVDKCCICSCHVREQDSVPPLLRFHHDLSHLGVRIHFTIDSLQQPVIVEDRQKTA